MQGLIFKEFINYVSKKYSAKIVEKILKTSGVNKKEFHDTIVYPDEDFIKIFSALLNITKETKNEILENFGKYITEDLINLGKKWKLIQENWDALTILENVKQIHKGVLLYSNVGTNVPLVEGERIHQDKIKIIYKSSRGLASLALGIIKGLALLLNEKLEIIILKFSDNDAEFIVKKTI